MQNFTIEIQHEVDNQYANHRITSCTLSVDADSYEQAIEQAEQKYFAEESPFITKYAKLYGMSFYQV